MSDQNEGYSLTFEELQDFIRQSGKNYNLELIEKAYSLAAAAHGEQKRRSGEPYIIHPLAVAKILVELGMDNESIAAALLHDVVEDTGVPLSDIEKQFGHEIALLVNGVTKLGRIPYTSKRGAAGPKICARCFWLWRRTSGWSSSSWPTACTTRVPFSICR